MCRIDSKHHTIMFQGFYFERTGMYLEDEADALEHAKELGFKNLEQSYEAEAHYWTEWECGDEFPFDEGEDYWTIEDGKVVCSCWDKVSEQIYMNADADKVYFFSEESANEYLGENIKS